MRGDKNVGWVAGRLCIYPESGVIHFSGHAFCVAGHALRIGWQHMLPVNLPQIKYFS